MFKCFNCHRPFKLFNIYRCRGTEETNWKCPENNYICVPCIDKYHIDIIEDDGLIRKTNMKYNLIKNMQIPSYVESVSVPVSKRNQLLLGRQVPDRGQTNGVDVI